MSFDNEWALNGGHGFLLALKQVLRDLVIDLAHLDGLNSNGLMCLAMES